MYNGLIFMYLLNLNEKSTPAQKSVLIRLRRIGKTKFTLSHPYTHTLLSLNTNGSSAPSQAPKDPRYTLVYGILGVWAFAPSSVEYATPLVLTTASVAFAESCKSSD